MSFLSENDFFKAVEEISKKVLNDEQREAVCYLGPLKVVAGPGSGKTEVLVLKTLYLMAVKGINPRSIFLVSFTKRASSELLTRLISYCGALKSRFPSLKLEPYEVYCGTLHSLCGRVMDELQFPPYQKKRLIESFERELLIYRSFKRLFEEKRNEKFFLQLERKGSEPPDLKQKVSLVSFLLDFLIQNLISEEELLKEKDFFLRASGKILKRYREVAKKEGILDYSLLEELFFNFLSQKSGEPFLKGDGSEYFPGVKFVLVDEYQDANPLDQEIYFKLSSETKNLTVVGDEDQALYRFRGAVVECFVNFEESFKERFSVEPKVVKLLRNYRSNRVIVDFLNTFMEKHKKGKLKEAWRELSSRKELLFSSGIDSSLHFPKAVLKLKDGRERLALFCLKLVKGLKEEGVIENYSDAVLLLPTTREVKGNGEKTLAGFVRELFERNGIPVYNPRSKSFKDRKEVRSVVGTLSLLLPSPKEVDEEVLSYLNGCPKVSVEGLNELRELAFNLELGLLEAFYRILPNLGELSQEELFNLGQLSQYLYYLENFARSEVERGVETSGLLGYFESVNPEELDREKLVRLVSIKEFYQTFLYLFVRGEVDQRELPEVPKDAFPVMTIHQSKGLEFPVVIVGEVGSVSPDFRLSLIEEKFGKFLKRNFVNSFERGVVDSVKRFFVAYSRAIYALFILLEEGIEEEKFWKWAALPDFGGKY
ncbi:UvrD-helicase domain-containing protein [Thermovibrio sp.]